MPIAGPRQVRAVAEDHTVRIEDRVFSCAEDDHDVMRLWTPEPLSEGQTDDLGGDHGPCAASVP